MLTPDQETARAVKASQLYGQPLPSELKKQTVAVFNWRLAATISGLLLIPALFTVSVFRFYLNVSLGNLSDVQATSILLIIELLAAVLILVFVLKYIWRALTDTFLGARLSIWLMFIGVIGSTFGALRLTDMQVSGTVGDVTMHIISFAIFFIPVSFLWSLGSIYVCDRLARR
jgi:hypothetical protein